MSKRKTTEEFIKEAKLIHDNKYDYSKVEYVNNHTKVCIICPEHGEFLQEPSNHLSGKGCPACKESQGEQKIRVFFENNNITFEPQKRFSWLGYQSLDFYLPEYNLGIEYDGIQYFEAREYFGGKETLLKQKELDSLKNTLCEEHGVKIIRISYKEFDDIDSILTETLLR